jgi:hypothetical protein
LSLSRLRVTSQTQLSVAWLETSGIGAAQRAYSSRKLGSAEEVQSPLPLLELYSPREERSPFQGQQRDSAAASGVSSTAAHIAGTMIPPRGGSGNARMRTGGISSPVLLSRQELEANRKKAYRSYAGDW